MHLTRGKRSLKPSDGVLNQSRNVLVSGSQDALTDMIQRFNQVGRRATVGGALTFHGEPGKMRYSLCAYFSTLCFLELLSFQELLSS